MDLPDLKRHVREVPDFPKPGILFYDISTLLWNADAFAAAVDALAEKARPFRPDHLVGIESRGFVFGPPLALRLGLGFAMVRKPGKLPGSTISHDYELEYGNDTLEIASDLIGSVARALVVDDLLATGGTAAATVQLLRKLGADPVGAVFVIELTALAGRGRLDVPVESLLSYDT